MAWKLFVSYQRLCIHNAAAMLQNNKTKEFITFGLIWPFHSELGQTPNHFFLHHLLNAFILSRSQSFQWNFPSMFHGKCSRLTFLLDKLQYYQMLEKIENIQHKPSHVICWMTMIAIKSATYSNQILAR